MQGKLVSNKTKDSKTGAELLAEIQTEKENLIKEKKIKKSKPLPPISEEEIPFEIPENWVWCRLGETGELKRGKSKHRPRNDENLFMNGIHPFIQTGDVARSKNTGYVIYTVNGYYNDFGLGQSQIQKKGTLCITIAANIAECGFLGFDACTPDSIVNYISIYKVIEKFVFYYLIDAKDEIEKYAPATAQKNINLGILNDLKIPFPSLHEQEQIVAKLDKLMQFCDHLETSVKESQKLNEQLLQQVLREALQPKAKEVVLPLVAEDREEYNTAKKSLKICDNGSITILAGYIIKKLSTSNPKDFGRVKLQKMLHLVEYQCRLETELHYKQKVAGPYAWELENVIEPKLKTYRFFDIKQDKLSLNNKVTYTALANAKELDFLFQKQFAEISDSINSLLQKFNNKSWEFCEMISTMYAVWNNRIIKNQTINKEELKKDFLAWDEKKIKYQDQLDYVIEWMKKEDLVPIGFGKYIEK